MQNDSKWMQIQKVVLDHTADIILTLLLLYSLIEPFKELTWAELVAGLIVRLPYLMLVWVPQSLRNERMRTLGILVIWIITLLYAQLFEAEYRIFELTFYLIGYTALKLPIHRSSLLGFVIIIGNAALLYMDEYEANQILVYSMAHAVTYILCWAARIRRESRQDSKRHYEELQQVHAELTQAHQELQDTHQELEQATVRLMQYAVLEERSRISMDLHDSVGNRLTSIIVQLQALPYMMKMDAAEADKAMGTVLEVVRQCLQEVRTVAHQMGSNEAGLGLVALTSLVNEIREMAGFTIKLTPQEQTGHWTPETSELLYRVLQEALTNIIRHAQASQVKVDILEKEHQLHMIVEDNGMYRKENSIFPGFGLSSMRARCERAGGSLSIDAVDPHGMRLTLTIPQDVKEIMGGDEK